MRITLITLTILFFSTLLNAQEECVFASTPTLLGVHLDSPVEWVNEAFQGDLKVKVKPEGDRTYFKNWTKRRAKGRFKDVRALYLRFFDGILYQIEVFYHDDFAGTDLDSFLDHVAEDNGFPPDNWIVKHGYAEFSCDGYLFEADRLLNPHIQISIESVAEEVKAYRKDN